ncbi:hypothetical protein [Verrucosispora sp. WMMC514]|uniref:hypothetical protein n=1 Tax=Verrucosispora sp. WMMC514 TaxID=3015156 RepID=UPI00248B42AF|nr:hypothetical protein [Verrucosispora sp. WMMC514]WBB91316.1 hypothetical protein O7597_30895 [Verrucosispora sp. WMMC514]
MHTTPLPPIDMDAVFPQLRGFARTTIRLHPRKGSPSVEQSSVGGPLLWPADEPWPTCDGDGLDDHPAEAEVPLVPVLQLLADDVPELPFPEGSDVLQVLWCPFDHDPWSAPLPRLHWRRRSAIGPRLTAMPPPHEDTEAWHLLTIASWEFSRGDERRWIALARNDRLGLRQSGRPSVAVTSEPGRIDARRRRRRLHLRLHIMPTASPRPPI